MLSPNPQDIFYSSATAANAEEIAALHTLSWQRHYKNFYPKTYLENEVPEERRKVWLDRFSHDNPKRSVIKAQWQNKIIGFACTYLNSDQKYGALVDNLHVLQEYQGLGIGKKLLALSASWVFKTDPQSAIYLYVLEDNIPARKFYQHLKAIMSEPFLYDNPNGFQDRVIRCSWDTKVLALRSVDR